MSGAEHVVVTYPVELLSAVVIHRILVRLLDESDQRAVNRTDCAREAIIAEGFFDNSKSVARRPSHEFSSSSSKRKTYTSLIVEYRACANARVPSDREVMRVGRCVTLNEYRQLQDHWSLRLRTTRTEYFVVGDYVLQVLEPSPRHPAQTDQR